MTARAATILLDDTEDGMLHVGVDFGAAYDGTSGAHRTAARLLKVLETELPRIGQAEIAQAAEHAVAEPPSRCALDPAHAAAQSVVPVSRQLVLATH